MNSLHTHLRALVNEFQGACVEDLKAMVDRLVPEAGPTATTIPLLRLRSAAMPPRTSSAALLGRSVAVGISGGELALGRFQSISSRSWMGRGLAPSTSDQESDRALADPSQSPPDSKLLPLETSLSVSRRIPPTHAPECVSRPHPFRRSSDDGDPPGRPLEQVANADCLPASWAHPWPCQTSHGYGLPVGGVVATDPDAGGVVSPGGWL